MARFADQINIVHGGAETVSDDIQGRISEHHPGGTLVISGCNDTSCLSTMSVRVGSREILRDCALFLNTDFKKDGNEVFRGRVESGQVYLTVVAAAASETHINIQSGD